MTSFADSDDMLTDHEKMDKMTKSKYLGQTTHLTDTIKEEIYARIRAAWSCLGENKEIFPDTLLHISLEKQVMD